MDLAAAKTARATAKRVFTIASKQLDTALGGKFEETIINGRFAQLKEAWADVMSKHATYLAIKYPDDEDVEEEDDNWLAAVADKFNMAEVSVTKHTAAPLESPKADDDLKRAYLILEFEKSQLELAINTVENVVKNEAPMKSINEAHIDMRQQLAKFKQSTRDHIMKFGEIDEKHSACLTKLQNLSIKAGIEAEKATAKVEKEIKKNLEDVPSRKQMDLKVERMKLPTFAGNIRHYSSFKSNFDKIARPHIEPESEAYVLKEMCLKGEALEIIKNVDHDASAIWSRLDDRFGKASKLVDVIMYDINNLKPVADGEDKKFLELVDCVERCHQELKRANMEGEISNSTIVGLIEERIPKTIQTMWYLSVSDHDTKIDETNKFPGLLDFLKKHRRAIEYGSSEIRSHRKGKVTFAECEEDIHVAVKSAPENESNSQENGSSLNKGGNSQENRNLNGKNRRKYCWYHQSSSHGILDCKFYSEQSVKERWRLINEYGACWSCLRIGHRHYDCYNAQECTKDNCQKYHHPSLHEDRPPIANDHPVTKCCHSSRTTACLLQIMKLPAGEKHVHDMNVMWDSGATVCLITFKKAKELELKGDRVAIKIVKVGGDKETVESKLYDVPVRDTQGRIEYFKAYGISKISSAIKAIETDQFAIEFEVPPEAVRRPVGEVDALIGLEYAGFHPEKQKSIGHLVLYSNRFGVCLGGTHEQLEEKTQRIVKDVEVSHVKAARIEDFYENEAMGTSCSPKCGGCKCGQCPIGGKQYTLQQERELALIERNLHLKDGTWYVQYPWIKKPEELPNNYVSALGMLKSTERKLKKNKELSNIYQQQIDDMIQRGVARKLSKDEVDRYSGPVHYICYHMVSSDSASTPYRLVFNSSAKFHGHVLNEYWAKGPDMINNLLGVLLRFRENPVAVAGDIKKMYHTVKIEEIDQHTHRFLWRQLEDREPDVYVMTALSFGDRPAAAIASLALQKTAENCSEQYPDAATTIISNSYVDDIIDSFASKQTAEERVEQINTILATGGFKIKNWIVSGQQSEEDLSMFDDETANNDSKVLGVKWRVREDQLCFKTKVNFSKRERKIRSEPDITKEELSEKIPEVLTKRMLLSQVNGVYDPLGLATPLTVCAKMLLRNLNALKLDWDDPIPVEEQNAWIDFFRELFDMESVRFNRSIMPENSVGDPTLIIFSDASEKAFGACAYARWQMIDGSFESRLIMAKSRLAPLKKITTVRLELNAALLSARIKEFIQREMRYNFVNTYLIVDSEIVRAMTQKDSYGFNTFVAVRVGEIQEKTAKNEWYWVEGELNIADIISRGAKAVDLMNEWQSGPKFLRKNESEWPIKQTTTTATLPEQIVMSTAMEVEVFNTEPAPLLDITRFSSYNKLINVTARVQAVFKAPSPSFGNASSLSREQLERAEEYWVIESQKNLHKEVKAQTLKRLGATLNGKVLVAGSRFESWQQCSYNDKNPAILSAKSEFAKLYAMKIHNQSHSGVLAVAAKIRSKYWIVGLRRLLRSIKFHCVTCKRLDKQLESQQMGQLPEYRLKPAPAWSYISLDLFGPILIRGETNKRTQGKAYGVIYTCLLSRAIHLDLAASYDTESFLMTLRRFMSIRGCPIKIYSDPGSQLKAADKELQTALRNMNMDAINEFGIANRLEWEFGSPDAPWRNGCVESLIKTVKKSIAVTIGEQVLQFSEMQTVLFEVANLVNTRPIGSYPTSVEDGVYLSPNDLLLGHSGIQAPVGPFNDSTSRYMRHRFVSKIIESFWRKWQVMYFPTLVTQQKWHDKKRNVQVGDIVLIQDSGMIKGRWKLGRVTAAVPSTRDGCVRTVEIQYKAPDAPNLVTITRPVQRICVILPVSETADI